MANITFCGKERLALTGIEALRTTFSYIYALMSLDKDDQQEVTYQGVAAPVMKTRRAHLTKDMLERKQRVEQYDTSYFLPLVQAKGVSVGYSYLLVHRRFARLARTYVESRELWERVTRAKSYFTHQAAGSLPDGLRFGLGQC